MPTSKRLVHFASYRRNRADVTYSLEFTLQSMGCIVGLVQIEGRGPLMGSVVQRLAVHVVS